MVKGNMAEVIVASNLKGAKSQGVIYQGLEESLAGSSKSTDEVEVKSPLPAYINFNERVGSLLITFGLIGEETLESDALALVSLSSRNLASIEILLDDKEVAKKLSEVLRPHRYR